MSNIIQPIQPHVPFTDKDGKLVWNAYDFLNKLWLRVGGSLDSLNAATLQTFTWEKPGTIGSTTPNSGKFTTLQATNTVTLSPANHSITMSPTGSGTVTISPATLGSINKMTIGGTTAETGTFTTLQATSAVTFTPANQNLTFAPTGSGIVTINPATLGSIDRVSLGQTIPAAVRASILTVDGAFGCNSKAAQTSYTSGGVVTTTSSTNIAPYGYTTSAQADDIITKLNNVIAALVANGIMS